MDLNSSSIRGFSENLLQPTTTIATITITVAVQTFYNTYKSAGFSPCLASIGILFVLLAIISQLGCACIVAVTVQKRTRSQFNSACNKLLALYSAFEFLHLCSYFVFAFVVLSGINFIPYRSCVYVQIIPLYFMCMAKILMLFIGIDRLLGVLFPIWYNRLHVGRYLSFMLFLSSMFATFFVSSAILDSFKPDKAGIQVPCVASDSFQGPLSELYYRTRSGMILATMGCYVLIWVLVKQIFASSRVDNNSLSVLKSMTVMNVCLLFGQLVNTVDRTVMELTSAEFQKTTAAWLITRLGILSMLVSLTMNAPILYMFSTDYRKALGLLLAKFPAMTKTVVTPETRRVFHVAANQLIQTEANARRLSMFDAAGRRSNKTEIK